MSDQKPKQRVFAFHAAVTEREKLILQHFISKAGWLQEADFIRLTVLKEIIAENLLPSHVKSELRTLIKTLEAKNIRNQTL